MRARLEELLDTERRRDAEMASRAADRAQVRIGSPLFDRALLDCAFDHRGGGLGHKGEEGCGAGMRRAAGEGAGGKTLFLTARLTAFSTAC